MLQNSYKYNDYFDALKKGIRINYIENLLGRRVTENLHTIYTHIYRAAATKQLLITLSSIHAIITTISKWW